MATYLVGDVQGCYRTLRALVAAVGFDPARDRMIFVGDLVNRGPHNTEVLRWLVAQGPSVEAVLGNHDLHLLARARGVSDAKRRDTLGDILTAPDRDALLTWVRHRPLLLRLDLPNGGLGHVVHAGLAPGMSLAEAEDAAAALAERLRGPEFDGVLRDLRGPAASWASVRRGADAHARQRAALQAFVYIRTCRADGTPDPTFAGALSERPPGHVAWFDLDPGPRVGSTVFFGHWAALGLYRGPGVLCLDTGAVWGRALTALRLEDGRIFSVDTVDVLTHGAAAGV